MRKFLIMLAMASWAGSGAGCGGGGATSTASEETLTTPEPETTAGNEEQAVESPTEEPPAPPRGPGQLRVGIRVGNESAAGRVRVLDESGEVAAEGNAGQTFTVPSGTYEVEAQITDQQVLFDRPTRRADESVTVAAGQETSFDVQMPLSRIRIHVRRRGREIRNWTIELTRDGLEGTIEMRPSSSHVPITPGRYTAVVVMGQERITVEGVVFPGGATRDLPIDIQ